LFCNFRHVGYSTYTDPPPISVCYRHLARNGKEVDVRGKN
jgi:hypothetical protein